MVAQFGAETGRRLMNTFISVLVVTGDLLDLFE
jgi:hypothetical protein